MGSLIFFGSKTPLALLSILVVVVIAFIPMFGGRFVFDDDATQYSLPAFKFYSEALRNGDSFYIVPQVLSGFPFYLSYVGGFYEPLNYFIFKTLSYPFAYYFRIFLNYLLSAVFVFLLALELGLSPPAAFIASLAFVTAQDIQGGANMVHSSSFFFLPGLFYVIAKLFKRERFFSSSLPLIIFLGIAIFAVGMLGGAAQLNLQSLVAILLFSLFLCWERRKEKGWVAALQPLVAALIIFAIGAVIFFPHLSRVMELVSYSDRRGGLSWEKAAPGGLEFSATTAPSFIYFFFPKTFQIPGVIESGGGGYVPFVGSASLFFFGAFLFSSCRDRRWYFWFFLFLFSALSSLPYPLFWLMHKLPIFSLFRNPASWLLVVSFVMSIMAGAGYDQFVKRELGFKKTMSVLGGLAVGLATAVFFLILYWPKEVKRVLNPPNISDIVLPLVLWLGTLTLVYFFTKKERLFSLSIPALLMLVAIVSFLVPFWTKLFKESSSISVSGIFKTPWVYQEIRRWENKASGREPFRTFNLYPGDSQWFLFVRPFNPNAQALADFQREVVRPNLYHLLDNIESVRGYDNLIPRRYESILNFIEGQPITDWVRRDDDGTNFIEVPPQRLRVLGMMNVKYIWSIFNPQGSLLGNSLEFVSSTVVKSQPPPLNLFLNKEFIPRVYSPASISFFKEKERNFEEVILRPHDFKKVGFIECKEDCPAGSVIVQTPPVIKIRGLSNDFLSFSAEGKKDAWVIVSNSFVPGWHAFVDGREVAIYYANYIYQGFRIPAGKQEVVLKYIR